MKIHWKEYRPQAKPDGPAGLSAELLDRMDACSKGLSKTRKKRVVSATLASPEAVAELSLLAAQPLHKTSKVCGSELSAVGAASA